MGRYPAGTSAPEGFYLNPLTGETAALPRGGGRLGGSQGAYVRLPVPAALAFVLAPLLGALYVIIMPFVGLALLAATVCRKLWAMAGAAGALGAIRRGPRSFSGT